MRLTTTTLTRLTRRPRAGAARAIQTHPIDPNHAAIFERLEVTKRFGLVSDYLVSWSGLAGQHSAKVTVWSKQGTPEDIVRHYIGQLLKGLVPGQRISVAAD